MSNPFTPTPGYYPPHVAWPEGRIARFRKHPQRFCANLPRAPREALRAIALVGDRARVVAVPWHCDYAALRASLSRLAERGLYRPIERGEVGAQPAAIPRPPAPGRRGSVTEAGAAHLPAPGSKYGSTGEPTPHANTEKPVLAAGRSPLNRSSMILRGTRPDGASVISLPRSLPVTKPENPLPNTTGRLISPGRSLYHSGPYLLREPDLTRSQSLTRTHADELLSQMTPRDIANLTALDSYGYLDTEQIAALNLSSKRTCQMRLKSLRESSTIIRWLTIEPPGWNKRQSVLVLVERGALLLARSAQAGKWVGPPAVWLSWGR